MTKLLDQLMARANIEREAVKLDPKRAELAGAMTRTVINEVLRDVQAMKRQYEAENAAPKGGTDK